MTKYQKLKNIHNIIKFYKQERYKSKLYYVIGEDRKIHKADLFSDKCFCGIKIIKNFVSKKDYESHFSCYECTF